MKLRPKNDPKHRQPQDDGCRRSKILVVDQPVPEAISGIMPGSKAKDDFALEHEGVHPRFHGHLQEGRSRP